MFSLNRTSRVLALAAVAGVGFGTAGCGGSSSADGVYPTAGRVVVDGQPAAGALVVFNPANPSTLGRPTGRTDAEGQFKLTTNTLDDGAPAGDYKVTVEWKEQLKTNRPIAEGDPVPTRDKVPPVYAAAATTPLKATVKTGGNEPHEIVIQTKK